MFLLRKASLDASGLVPSVPKTGPMINQVNENSFSQHGRVPEGEEVGEQQFRTPWHIVYADEVNSGLCWSSEWMVRALRQLLDVSIPNNVRELCPRCFQGCKSLRRVIFGPSSTLERIGTQCFAQSGLLDFEILSTVETIGGGALVECPLSGGVMCRDGCRFRAVDGLVLSHDCELCYSSYGFLSSVCIPDSVRELCDQCFQGRKSLHRVTFGPSSSLERIGFQAFRATCLTWGLRKT